jgi:hypothetical protein
MMAKKKPAMPPPNWDEIDAQYKYYCGDAVPLAEFVRSGEPLSQLTRDMLADTLDGKFKKKRGAKPRLNLPKILVHGSYDYFKSNISESNIMKGDEGHWASCEKVAQMLSCYGDVTPQTIDKIIYPRVDRHRQPASP